MIYYLGLVGGFVFAVSGSLAAGRLGLDWVGVLVLALVTAVGGGTIRDVLLNQTVFWIADPSHLWVTLFGASFTILYARFFRPPMRALLIADALGLALFSIVGAQIAEAKDSHYLIVILMGLLTGAAGGVIRDVLCREIPLLLRATETLYTTAALGGILVYLFLQTAGVDRSSASICGVSVAAAIRLAAIFWEIRLPTFHISTQQ